MKLFKFSALALFAFALNAAAATCDLPKPEVAADLVITGEIGRCTVDKEAQFDAKLFAQLPRHKIRTTNPWDEGESEYEGVLFSDLLDYLKASGSKVSIEALNDYSSEVSVEELKKFGVLLADKHNGEAMTVEEKGPYFVVFPFDAKPELRSEERYSQSVWQVSRITIKP